MLKLLVLSFMLGLSLRSFGADILPRGSYSDFKCKAEVQKELEKVFSGKNPEWERTVDPSFDTQAFRTSTVKTGEWYELQIAEKDTPKLFFYSAAKSSVSSWNKTCKAATTNKPGLELFKAAGMDKSEIYSDAELAKLMSDKRTALIYVWSPRMVYSVTEFTRMRALAEKRKMEFVPVLDPLVDVSEARAAIKKAGIDFKIRSANNLREPSSIAMYKRMNSVDLYMRNATLHFPTVFLVANGKMHSHRIVGVMTNDGMNASLDEMMGELK
jgi:hypothetical protein